MAVTGYIDHANRNRRLTWWLIAVYILAIELIAAFALAMVLLLLDPEHTVLSNPIGYMSRYAVPVGAAAGLQFWFLYRRHAKAVMRSLNIYLPTREEEPRFWQIAEEQCTALGVRMPKFGVIEVDALNALAVGQGTAHGLIAVTRGILDHLDDEELAAILAHEASHIRNGDTRLQAASHALMRTAAIVQVYNPLRFQDWRQVALVVLVPPMLLILLISGALTMTAMRLAWFARRRLKLSRDHIADGEAIRITHFPEALISALRKIEGRGAFQRSDRLDSLMFEGKTGNHPAVQDRIRAISILGQDLIQPGRLRRDTRRTKREASSPVFGRRVEVKAWRSALVSKQSGKPEEPSLRMYALFFTDNERFWLWQNARIEAHEWQEGGERNSLGLTSTLTMMFAAAIVGSIAVLVYRTDNLSQFIGSFNPAFISELMKVPDGGGLICTNSSLPEKKCSAIAGESKTTSIADSAVQTGGGLAPGSGNGQSFKFGLEQIFGYVFVFAIVLILNPKLRRFLFDGLRR